MNVKIDMSRWYKSEEAAVVLSHNSGKTINSDYVRTLARNGLVATLKVSDHLQLYSKSDIDAYVVRKRGRPRKENSEKRERTKKSVA